jgi:hypothetical protein
VLCLKTLNEVPQLAPYHILRPQGTSPSVSIREGTPIVADADNGIGAVNSVNENIFVHLIFLSHPTSALCGGALATYAAGLGCAFFIVILRKVDPALQAEAPATPCNLPRMS